MRRRRYRVVGVNRLDEIVTEFEHGAARQAACLRAGPVRLRLLPLADAANEQFAAVSCATSSTRSRSPPPRTSRRCGSRSRRSATTRVRCALLEPGAEAVVEGPYGSFSSRGAERAPDLDRGRDRRDAVPEHGPEPERRRDPRSTSTTASSTRPRRTSSTSCARSRGSATASASRSCRARPTASSRPSASRRRTRSSRSTDVLVCGPPAMIDSLRSQLVGAGCGARTVPRGGVRLREDRPAAPGGGAARRERCGRTPSCSPRSRPSPSPGRRWRSRSLIGTYLLARGR